jgi:hypothetical protein
MKTINEYLDFLKRLSNKKTRAIDYVQEILDEYKNVRIEKTNLETDGDMLLLQWEERNEIGQFTITRQIVQDENGTIEFDDCAVQVHIILYFGNRIGSLESGNIWIESPEVINERLSALESEGVKQLLSEVPDKTVVHMSHV